MPSKIFMTAFVLIALFTGQLTGNLVLAQAVSITANAPKVVYQGDQFRLSYQLNAKPESFENPEISDFGVLSGPNVSSSSSVQIINGSMSQSVQYTYTYILDAPKAGKFTISPAKAKVKGNVYQSNAVSIEVVQRGSQPLGGGESQATTQSAEGKDIFVRITTDKTNVYQGEKIVATIMIYTKKNLGGFEDYKFPAFSGFWSNDLEAPTTLNFNSENVGGTIYQGALLKKVLLIPQRSGKIDIEPFTAKVLIRQQVRSNDPFEDFFGGNTRTTKVEIASPVVSINVKPLPDNKPAGFDGAVGDLKLSSTISKTEVKTNEAVTLSIRISGQGNIKFISAPKVAFPPDLDLFDPKTTLSVQNTNQGMAGNVTFDYLFIPRHAGNYRIPPVTFSYFDINDKQYRTFTTPEYTVKVERGEGDAELTTGVVQGLTKEDVKYLGEDIHFIKPTFELRKKQSFWFGASWFWAWYIGLTLLFAIALLVRRVQIVQNANQAKVKNRKANSVSRKRLKQAAAYLKQGNKEKFYDEVLRALWGYLSDKLQIPVSELTKDNAVEVLQKHSLDVDTIKQTMDLIDACEFARFAPATVSGGMDEIYSKAGQLITILDQKIR